MPTQHEVFDDIIGADRMYRLTKKHAYKRRFLFLFAYVVGRGWLSAFVYHLYSQNN